MGQTFAQPQTANGAPPPDLSAASPAATAPPTGPNLGINAPQPAQPQTPVSKGHKLLQILQSGIQGALAGRAASEQEIAQTGGRRAGGVGTGFEAGFTLPWQRAGQQLGIEQQAANVEATRAQNAIINTPNGPMPAWLAKYTAPAYIKAGATTGAAQIGATSREDVARTQQQTQQQIHRYIPVPGVGLFDTQTRQTIPETEQGITITPEIAADHNLPQQFIGKPMSLQQLAAVQRSDVFQNSPMMTAQGPVVINRKNATATPVQGPGGQRFSPPALASPKEVADVNNPGQTTIVPAGQSFGQPGVGSASVQVPRRAELAEVPTNIGNKKVAFTTMIQHADLLRNAARALSNGDQQTLAGLKNQFKNEFGYDGPVTAQAIADAYGNEVADVVSKGHITDKEVEKAGRTINPLKQNFATINSVLNAYQALAQSKMNNLNKQSKAAVSASQPKGAQPVITHIWTPKGLQPAGANP